MAITATDIQFRLSGGAANSDVNASLGGAKSSTEVVDATLHNLFDVVSSTEASSGDTEYRCIYVHNNHGTLTLQATKIWMTFSTPSGDTTMAIGLQGAVNSTAEDLTAASPIEGVAPSTPAVSFSTAATSEGTAITIGDIPAGQHQAVWIRRVIGGGATAYNTDNVTLNVKGDTAA